MDSTPEYKRQKKNWPSKIKNGTPKHCCCCCWILFVCVAHRESIFPFHTHIYKRTQDQHHHQPQFICVQTFHSISQTSPSSSSYLETSHNNNNLPYQCNGCKNSLCVCIQNENKHNKHPWICGSGSSSSSYHIKHT